MLKSNLPANMLLLLFALLSVTPLSASTGVGNGGDLIDRFLAVTRYNLTRTVQLVRDGRDIDDLCTCNDQTNQDISCSALQLLSSEQQAFCRDFIIAIAPQLLLLNRQDPIVPFVLSDATLNDTDAAGYKRQVKARTDLGPMGAITFHYNSIGVMSQKDLMALMAHEMGHKTLFRGAYVGDNVAIGPFSDNGGGRMLLDTIGSALAQFAATHHLIENSSVIAVPPLNVIVDHFECSFDFANTNDPTQNVSTKVRFTAIRRPIDWIPRPDVRITKGAVDLSPIIPAGQSRETIQAWDLKFGYYHAVLYDKRGIAVKAFADFGLTGTVVLGGTNTFAIVGDTSFKEDPTVNWQEVGFMATPESSSANRIPGFGKKSIRPFTESMWGRSFKINCEWLNTDYGK